MKSCLKEGFILVPLLLLLVLGFYVFALLFSGNNSYVPVDKTQRTWLTSNSTNGRFSICVIQDGSTSTFGSQHILVYMKCDNSETVELFETEIANDGKNLNNDNYCIEWNGYTTVLTFYGEEQSPETWIIEFSSNDVSYSKIIREKSGLLTPSVSGYINHRGFAPFLIGSLFKGAVSEAD